MLWIKVGSSLFSMAAPYLAHTKNHTMEFGDNPRVPCHSEIAGRLPELFGSLLPSVNAPLRFAVAEKTSLFNRDKILYMGKSFLKCFYMGYLTTLGGTLSS